MTTNTIISLVLLVIFIIVLIITLNDDRVNYLSTSKTKSKDSPSISNIILFLLYLAFGLCALLGAINGLSKL